MICCVSRLSHNRYLPQADDRLRFLAGSTELFALPDHQLLVKQWGESWPTMAWFHVNPWRARDRWVRYHYLPRSKEYPTTPAEDREILRRYRDVLAAVAEDSDQVTVMVEAYAYSSATAVPRKPAPPEPGVRRILGDASWLGVLRELNEDDYDGWAHLWVTQMSVHDSRLTDLFEAVTSMHERPVIMTEGCRRVFRPYEGGVDVCVESEETRQTFLERFPSWLSPLREWEPRADETPQQDE